MERAKILNKAICPGVTLAWRFGTDHSRTAWGPLVSVSPYGSLIAAVTEKTLYALDCEGTLVWKHYFDFERPLQHILATANGIVVYSVWGPSKNILRNLMYMISPQGKILQKYARDVEDGYYNPLACSMDGTKIAAGTGWDEGELHLFDSKGGFLWKRSIEGPVCSLSLSCDGSLVAVGSKYHTLLFTEDGNALWKHKVQDDFSNVSIVGNAPFVAVGSKGLLELLDSEGKSMWAFSPARCDRMLRICGSADGSHIAIAAHSSKREIEFHLLTMDGKQVWTHRTGTEWATLVSVRPEASVMAVDSDPLLDDKLKAGSPYPQFLPCSVYLLSSEGQTLWKFNPGGGLVAVESSCDGTCVATTNGDNVLLFRCGVPKSPLEDMKREIVDMIKKALNQGVAGETSQNSEQENQPSPDPGVALRIEWLL